jgi:ATP-dependent Lon protease
MDISEKIKSKKRKFSENFLNLEEIKIPKKKNTSYEINIIMDNENNEKKKEIKEKKEKNPRKKKCEKLEICEKCEKFEKFEKNEIIASIINTDTTIENKKKITQANLKKLDVTQKEYELMTEEEINYWKKISKDERLLLKNLEQELNNYDVCDIPERYRILKFPIDIATKRNIMERFSQLELMQSVDPEYFKLSRWIEGIMKIPFGKYINLPVSINDNSEKISEYINEVSMKMNSSIAGHLEAKEKIIQVVCQWISNPKSSGNIIALHGPPGIGKTSLVRNGISNALGRPFHMIALGGATDSTFLEGHNYTYEGANWGRIASILMDSKVMNPIIFFDELDKVSGTKHGDEIIGVLTHLTDQTQNNAFQDKYFSGIDIDLSRCLFIFSYNNESILNPILKDRLIKINLKGFSVKEKTDIAKNYIIKELFSNIGLEANSININDEIITEIIENFTDEDGVRELRRCLETIFLKINMSRFTENIKFPIELNSELIKKYLKNPVKDDYNSKTMMYI